MATALFTLDRPDGSRITLEADENSTLEQLEADADELYGVAQPPSDVPTPEQAQAPAAPVEPSFGQRLFDANQKAFKIMTGGVPYLIGSAVETGRTPAEIIGDVGNLAIKGAIGVPETAVGILDIPTLGYAGKLLESIGVDFKDARKVADNLMMSDPQRAANERVEKAEGIIGTLSAAFQNPSVIATTIGESIPTMLAGGVVAKSIGALPWLAKAAPVIRAALGEGAVTAGSAAEGIRQQTEDGLLTIKQAITASATGGFSAAFGLLGGKVAKMIGIDDIDTLLAKRVGSETLETSGKKMTTKEASKKFMQGAITEGILEEMPQSASEQLLQNYALDRPLFEGMEQSVILGTLAGMAVGGPAALKPFVQQSHTPEASGAAGVVPDWAAQQAAPVAPRKFAPAPDEILNRKVVDVPEGSVADDALISHREGILKAIGLNDDEMRVGALTGNHNEMGKEIMISKSDDGGRMTQQLDKEANLLGQYAKSIVDETGGKFGQDEIARGVVIADALEGGQAAGKNINNALYAAARDTSAKLGRNIKPTNFAGFLNNKKMFVGEPKKRGLLNFLKIHLKEEGVLNTKGKNLDISELSVSQIEDLKELLNGEWTPETSGLIAQIKKNLDEDVFSVLPKDIYGAPRKAYSEWMKTFSDPKAIGKILDISGPGGINRAVSKDKLAGFITNLAKTDSDQFLHIMDILENKMPTPELAEKGKTAAKAIRAGVVEDMLKKNVSPTEMDEVAGKVRWKSTHDALDRSIEPYRGKIEKILGEDAAKKIKTLEQAAVILRRVDPNPSGSGTIVEQAMKKGLEAGGAILGGVVSATAASPLGLGASGIAGAAGAAGGRTIAQKAIKKMDYKQITKATDEALSAAKRAEAIKKIRSKQQ